MKRGILVALLQCLIVLSTYGKYALDRERLPRIWARAAIYDPNLPIRGRYLSIRLEVEGPPAIEPNTFYTGHLSVRDGHLSVEPDNAPADSSTHVRVVRNGTHWSLVEPVAFFLPEHAADPSHPPAGKELWVEVSVPRKGPPRPIQLEVR